MRASSDGYAVATTQGGWQCDTVLLATGACNIPQVPAVAEAVPSGTTTLTPMHYRNPGQLANGGVLVVGASASATGTQIADEIHDGAADDARDLSAHLSSYLGNRTSVTRPKRQVLSR